MNNLIESFLSYKQHNDGRSVRTVKAYGDALARLVEFFGERDPLLATPGDLDVFAGIWLHKRGVEAISRRPYVSAVREFYKWLEAAGHTKSNQASGLAYPKHGRKIPRVITLANAERLMWAPDFSTFEGVRDGAMLAVLMGCGLRVTGLVTLNEGDLGRRELDGEIRLVLKTCEKGDRERLVPVPREAELLLQLYLEHPDLKGIDRTLPNGDRVLFVSTMNRMCLPHEYIGERRRLSSWAVRDTIQRHGKRAGIPQEQLHPHALRHLYGTELAESDIDLLTRQDLLGHEDPKSTAIYTHLAMRKKMQVVDRANPLGKMRTPVSELLKHLGPTGRKKA
ncbi:MAG: tyrosine-type recombinase/integrase [Gammaproteobacteria bacterium]|nr:tyrosine-type recombinase/integrase [Gammaproteobacteria bacterium]